MPLDQIVEGVLFYKATPLKKAALQKLLGVGVEDLNSALETLKERLKNGATRLLITDTEISLVTAPELDELIETIRKDELKRDIGRAGAETLAIILYRGPITRTDIDRIRGVNSSFILRNLLMRGLIEKSGDNRNTLYSTTSSLLAHLGVDEKTALPDWQKIMKHLDVFEAETATQSI